MKSMRLKYAAGGRLVLCLVLGFTVVTALTAVVATTPKANADNNVTSTALVTVSARSPVGDSFDAFYGVIVYDDLTIGMAKLYDTN